MTKEKPGVMIYFETAKAIKQLDYETKGRLFEAILEYAEFGVVPEFNNVLSVVWPFVSDKIDRDSEKYEKIRQARINAGQRGGQARADNLKQKQANEANATFDKQIKPSVTVTTSATTALYPSANAKEGIMENGEREKGAPLTSCPHLTSCS